MGRDAAIFWIVVLALVCASIFYGVNVEKQRRRLQHAGAELETGCALALIAGWQEQQ